MFGGLFNKEEMVKDTINDLLKDLKEELGCSDDGLFVMIKPIKDEKGEAQPRFMLYSLASGPSPKYIRDLTIKEVLGEEEEGDN